VHPAATVGLAARERVAGGSQEREAWMGHATGGSKERVARDGAHGRGRQQQQGGVGVWRPDRWTPAPGHHNIIVQLWREFHDESDSSCADAFLP
jgi:hypothetical protein